MAGKEQGFYQVFEVFSRKAPDAPMQHQFSLLAPNEEIALVMAQENFMRREPVADLWVVKRDYIRRMSEEEKAALFRLLSEKASFAPAFIHVGLVPDAGHLYYLPRLVGRAKALELAVLGDKISAEQAASLGLATKVIPLSEWEEGVKQFAERLAAMPTKAIGLIKRLLREGEETTFDRYLEREAECQRDHWAPRGGQPDAERVSQLYRKRACRCVRPNHSLELSAHDGGLENRASHCRWMLGRR
ncbi:enoyl-CoA hydratase-related protein [Geobacillus stearothermophilus]|nr:enoyl-CoA hydratase-related protein [Geobacillus stearothermophilus]